MSRTSSLIGATVATALLVACGAAPRNDTSVEAPIIEVGSAAPIEPREVPVGPLDRREPAKEHDDCIADLLAGHPLRAAAAQADQALYVEAHDAMLNGNAATARKKLLELTEIHKRSSFVPLAYLLFGEMFAQEAQSDPTKVPIALNFYQEVVKFPPRDNPAYAYALLKLGDMHAAMGNHANALLAFRRVLDAQAKRQPAACMPSVAPRAKRSSVAAYAEGGDPHKAFAFFKPLGGDPTGSNEQTFAMMTLLAHLMASKDVGRAAAVVNDILRRGPQAHACQQLRQLVAAHNSLESQVGSAVRSSCR